jgi:predicted metal-dependent phosphoesterase TrpH
MAHPGTVRHDEAIPVLKEMGLDGIEVYHSKHTTVQLRYYKSIATRLDLLISGGSDWHGRSDPKAELGNQRVPYVVLERMKDYLAKRR